MKITLKLKNGDFSFDVAKVAIKYTKDGVEIMESGTTINTPVVTHPHAVQKVADIDLEKYITSPFTAVLEVPDIHHIYDYVNQAMDITDFTAIISTVAEYMVTNHHAFSTKFVMLVICYTAIAAGLRVQNLVLALKLDYINMNNIKRLYTAIYTDTDDAAEYRFIRDRLSVTTAIFTKARPRTKAYNPDAITVVGNTIGELAGSENTERFLRYLA